MAGEQWPSEPHFLLPPDRLGWAGKRLAQMCWREESAWLGAGDPGCGSGAASNVLCDVDELLSLVKASFLCLFFERGRLKG